LATPASNQDSSLVRTLAGSVALIVRPPHAPAADKGEPCRILRFARLGA
jgi:molybdopterin molybdotransferase